MKRILNLLYLISITLLVVWVITGCSKGETIYPDCQRVYYFSDFYSKDSVYLRTVEVKPFRENNLICGVELGKVRNEKDQWLPACPPLYLIEHRRVKIGNENSYPIIFKK